MKTTLIIALCLVFHSTDIMAQVSEKNLNQVELMKQWIGSWRTENPYISSQVNAYGIDGLEGFQRIQVKDSILSEYKFIYGFDKKSDKYIFTSINTKDPGITLMAFWFTSKSKCERIPFEFIPNPEQATSKAVYEFKTKDLIIATFTEKDKPDRIYRIIREKNNSK